MERLFIKGILRRFLLGICAITVLCARVEAGLVLDHLQSGEKKSIEPDGAIEVSLTNFQGRFFGRAAPSSIWVAENGYLSKTNLSIDGDTFSESLAINTSPRIAGFWDDISIFQQPNGPTNHGVFWNRQPNSYIAVTWSNVLLANDLTAGTYTIDELIPLQRSFQAVWFEANTTIDSFQFLKDDIAFGFSGFSTGSIDATVGIRDNSRYFSIDDALNLTGQAAGGVISTNTLPANANLLPWQEDKFLLFRSVTDDSGNYLRYQVSVESLNAVAIPEPSSVIFFSVGAGAYWLAKRRKPLRRKHGSQSD